MRSGLFLFFLGVVMMAVPAGHAGAAPSPKRPPVGTALFANKTAEAKELAHSEPGRTYLRECKHDLEKAVRVAQLLYRKLSLERHKPFRMDYVVIVSADGHIREILAKNHHAFTPFLGQQLQNVRLARPPRDGWPVEVIILYGPGNTWAGLRLGHGLYG